MKALGKEGWAWWQNKIWLCSNCGFRAVELVLTHDCDCLAGKGMDPKYKVGGLGFTTEIFFFFFALSAELPYRIFLYFQLFLNNSNNQKS